MLTHIRIMIFFWFNLHGLYFFYVCSKKGYLLLSTFLAYTFALYVVVDGDFFCLSYFYRTWLFKFVVLMSRSSKRWWFLVKVGDCCTCCCCCSFFSVVCCCCCLRGSCARDFWYIWHGVGTTGVKQVSCISQVVVVSYSGGERHTFLHHRHHYSFLDYFAAILWGGGGVWGAGNESHWLVNWNRLNSF